MTTTNLDVGLRIRDDIAGIPPPVRVVKRAAHRA
jgi:hypothetical protein